MKNGKNRGGRCLPQQRDEEEGKDRENRGRGAIGKGWTAMAVTKKGQQ